MSDCRVRPYASTDRDHLRVMMNALQAAERVMEPDRADWPDRADSYVKLVLTEVGAKRGAIFVAEIPASGVIGFVTCWQEYEDDSTIVETERDYLYVGDLYVAEDARGRGIAGLLLAAAEAHGRALGLKQTRIGVLSVNRAARRSYEKAGFEEYEMLLRKRL
jgi:ribosomal protein S18 acetylase RimI-like enzyme